MDVTVTPSQFGRKDKKDQLNDPYTILKTEKIGLPSLEQPTANNW